MILPWEAEQVRVYIGESDQWLGQPMHEHIVAEARRRDVAGVTVLRGIGGFGATSRARAQEDAVSSDSPIVVEIVDKPERVWSLLLELQQVIRGCLITAQKVRVITYRPEETVTQA